MRGFRKPLLALTLVAACGGERPLVAMGCLSDSDCDPGDVCAGGRCQGTSSGRPDAGGPDAGTPDAGVAPGRLAVQPANVSVTTQAGAQPPPAVFDLGNAGGEPIRFAIACDGNATPAPASGSLAPRETMAISVALPVLAQAGQQSITCTAAGNGSGVTFTVTATVTPAAVAVGPDGGAVDLLDFTVTGDTRPPACDLTFLYPKEIIRAEVLQMSALAPQFALDLGDHMFVCTESAQRANEQMLLYVQALAGFSPPWFMTMGNHECLLADCSGVVGTLDANYNAYLAALRQVSRHDQPFYKLDITTRLGLARIVFVADNLQSAEQKAWLESTLSEADRIAKYTIIAKHHPIYGSRMGPLWTWQIIQKHKYSLILTAHAHAYIHPTEASGRSVICGLGGASSSATGFCRVKQLATGELRFMKYDISGNPQDSWSVTPQ
jgi:hypothetical protein